MQLEGRPFVEIHGDPDVLDMTKTRFGPTTKILPLMERHHYKTFGNFMQLPLLRTARPSPGASVCLGNAHRDDKRIVEFLGEGYFLDEEKFQNELGEVSPVVL